MTHRSDEQRSGQGLTVRRRASLTGAAAVTAEALLIGCREDGSTTGSPQGNHTEQHTADRAMLSQGLGPDVTSVTSHKTLSGTVRAAAIDVQPGAELEFDPHTTTTLIVTGNILVQGTLRMRPADPTVTHTIRFVGVDESAFQGSGMALLKTDTGLWVMGGRLDLRGTPRRGWNRTGQHDSWLSGDQVLRAPIERQDFDTYVEHRPGATVPTVRGPDGEDYATEVFDLTRNVVIEGQPKGRAHMLISSQSPQSIRYALFRWMGPRQPAPSNSNANTQVVTGRYPVHFHHCGDGSRGSIVEGCVVRDSSRAYVPHASHGITMRDCIAYRILDDAFWWDQRQQTDDLLWDHCAVFDLRYDPVFRGKVAGFLLGMGENMTIHDCVVTGAHGNGDDAGFQWPSFANQRASNVWHASDLRAHNCQGDGVFVWQNDNQPHVIERVVCYRNSQSGLQHGAYRNIYHYRHLVLFDNGDTDLRHQALGKGGPGLPQYQQWDQIWAPRMLIGDHASNSSRTVKFLRSHIDEITVNEWKSGGGSYEIHTDIERKDVHVVAQKSKIEIIRPDGTRFDV